MSCLVLGKECLNGINTKRIWMPKCMDNKKCIEKNHTIILPILFWLILQCLPMDAIRTLGSTSTRVSCQHPPSVLLAKEALLAHFKTTTNQCILELGFHCKLGISCCFGKCLSEQYCFPVGRNSRLVSLICLVQAVLYNETTMQK